MVNKAATISRLIWNGSIFSADGKNVGSWGTGTNLAFGGDDGMTVLVAGSGKQLRELKMNVPGLP